MSEQETSQSVEQQAAELEKLASHAETEDAAEALEGEYQTEEPEGLSTGELCTALLSMGFSLVASRRGSHWALSQAEATETGKAVGDVMDKYFPDMSTHGPELSALLVVGMVLAPRMMHDSALKEQEERREQAQQEKQPQKATRQHEKQDAPTLTEGGLNGD